MTELKSNTEWRRWGRTDPLWAVASWGNKQKDGASPWSEEEFYRLGESDWLDFVGHWRQYGLDTRNCLEIGCGAGRITRSLSSEFHKVHAVDVSEAMIAFAQIRVHGGNVTFSVNDGVRLPLTDCSVTSLFSTHVLQHIDSQDLGFSYFREFFRVLNFGGTLMIHLPLYQLPSGYTIRPLFCVLYSLYRGLGQVRADMRRRLGLKVMRATHYDIPALEDFLTDLGFKDIEFRIFKTKSNGQPHSFVFATK